MFGSAYKPVFDSTVFGSLFVADGRLFPDCGRFAAAMAGMAGKMVEVVKAPIMVIIACTAMLTLCVQELYREIVRVMNAERKKGYDQDEETGAL